MGYSHGSIVLLYDPYKDGVRPFFLISNSSRPYFGQQYTLAVISTQERGTAVRIEENDLVDGELNVYPSYINTWSLHEFEHSSVIAKIAQASDSIIDDAADSAYSFLEL